MDSDIKINGVVVYPKGTSFNPLAKSTYPKSIRNYSSSVQYDKDLVFFDARDNQQVNFVVELLKDLHKKNKIYKLIMTGGNIADTSKYLNERVYFDQDGRLVFKMGIQHVPTLVYQDGNHFNLQEYSVERLSTHLQKTGETNVK